MHRPWLISVSLYCLISDHLCLLLFIVIIPSGNWKFPIQCILQRYCLNKAYTQVVASVYEALCCQLLYPSISQISCSINKQQSKIGSERGCSRLEQLSECHSRRLSFGFRSAYYTMYIHTYICTYVCMIRKRMWCLLGCTCQTQIRTCWRAPQSRLIRHGLSPGIISITYQVSSI